ncbi:fumarylacetoacetate hydrolase family protein [Marinobacterium lutimaris]|uniref:5-oxopent-3-ene-1,2,5-tricarboxylate decarboxylase / 2-hydroxyhepta-2,4-diene-1,7-dioate isomerase n=1 Tax=Marinobacterium lutimaris TaxID=568106 RepID=A0A1H6C0R1_9GAMM|nr:fumarylacetoacetate hydrolase family protein [Marinobacterium lutimaris]SEG66502.1 5-oxopent-3-ene-1,2,5-tricarboxylate decarboxylase / 2-hydroxyhepta-2,4-diene-1,7-dioate isomerase [Marinobacterium lutimaris]
MTANTLVNSKLVCVALNDKAQLAALEGAFNEAPYKKPPTQPVLYYKPRNTWSVNGAEIEWAKDFDGVDVPAMAVGASLGVVIGKEICRVSAEDALDYVVGYTLVSDFSLPEESYYRPDIKGKCLDGSAPVGPTIVPADQISNPDALRVTLSVNGHLRSNFELSGMQRGVAELISIISHIMTLQPGEMIAVGFAGDRVAVAKGDRVDAQIEGVGTLTNTLGGA